MTVQVYDIGDAQPLRCNFLVDNVLSDPTTITLQVEKPSGTITSYVYGVNAELQRLATGSYQLTVQITERGTWWYRWVGTGAAEGAEEGRFYVRERQVV